MKKQLKFKIMFDVFLAAVWIVLMVYSLTGSFLHELLGIIIFLLFAVHVAVNYKWIIAVTKKLFGGKFTATKFKYIIDSLLLISVTLTTVSGILISKELLSSLSSSNFDLWYFIHSLSAYISLAVISVHIGLHWRMIVEIVRKTLKIKQVSRIRSILCKLFSLAIVIFGFKSSIEYNLPEYSTETYMEPNGYALNTAEDVSTSDTTQKLISAAGMETKTKLTIIATFAAPNTGETLENYLGRLICTGCHNRCSLLSPRCNIGERQATSAENYYKQYASAKSGGTESKSSGTSSSNNNSTSISSNSSYSKSSSPAAITENTVSGETDVPGILSTMGMYIAGTYYIVEFVEKKKI